MTKDQQAKAKCDKPTSSSSMSNNKSDKPATATGGGLASNKSERSSSRKSSSSSASSTDKASSASSGKSSSSASSNSPKKSSHKSSGGSSSSKQKLKDSKTMQKSIKMPPTSSHQSSKGLKATKETNSKADREFEPGKTCELIKGSIVKGEMAQGALPDQVANTVTWEGKCTLESKLAPNFRGGADSQLTKLKVTGSKEANGGFNIHEEAGSVFTIQKVNNDDSALNLLSQTMRDELDGVKKEETELFFKEERPNEGKQSD